MLSSSPERELLEKEISEIQLYFDRSLSLLSMTKDDRLEFSRLMVSLISDATSFSGKHRIPKIQKANKAPIVDESLPAEDMNPDDIQAKAYLALAAIMRVLNDFSSALQKNRSIEEDWLNDVIGQFGAVAALSKAIGVDCAAQAAAQTTRTQFLKDRADKVTVATLVLAIATLFIGLAICAATGGTAGLILIGVAAGLVVLGLLGNGCANEFLDNKRKDQANLPEQNLASSVKDVGLFAERVTSRQHAEVIEHQPSPSGS